MNPHTLILISLSSALLSSAGNSVTPPVSVPSAVTITERVTYIDTVFGQDAYDMPSSLVPLSMSESLTVYEQLTWRNAGASTPESVLHQHARKSQRDQERRMWGDWVILPSTPQKFMPYLDSLFVMGNTCTEPSGLIQRDALSTTAQRIKTAASHIGLQYNATVSVNYTAVASQSAVGQRNFVSTNNELWANWFLAKSADDSTGLFLMVEADWGQGFGYDQRKKNVQQTIGSLSNPQSSNRGGNGAYFANVSLGMSLCDGALVLMAGTIDTTNFLDQNVYSADWNGNLLNESFNFNPALPLTDANWGYLAAWQPCKEFYLLFSSTGTNTETNQNPFTRISSGNWANIVELGMVSEDVLGMGKGIYRVQYANATNNSETGSGAGVNIQQQLGHNSSLGFFTRLGWVDEDMAAITGTRAAITAGLVMQSPFDRKGWGAQANNDQFAFGFLWQRAAESERPYKNSTEHGFELSAVFQVTPTCFIQPDIQYIINPVHRKGGDNQLVFQLQTTFRF